MSGGQGLPEVLAPLADDVEAVGVAYEEILRGVGPETRTLIDQAARFSGKRLRPALACLAARIGGATVTGDVAAVAAIVELIHTATLVHDDVIDGATIRRRRPTLNASWGPTAAVLVGDVLFSRAYLCAANLEDRFASRYLAAVVGEVLEGEILQDTVVRTVDLPVTTYERIIRGKTAALYEASLHVGAHYAGAADDVVHHLARFGHHVGMAFQIVDDRLDLEGDERKVGKSLGTDLAEGKMTLAPILWRDQQPPSSRDTTHALIERAWEDATGAAALIAELRRSGALDAAQARAEHEVALAREHLMALPQSEARELLETLASYTLTRSW